MDTITGVIEQLTPEFPPPATGMVIDTLTIELPLELYVRGKTAGNGIVLEASGPRQRVATTIVPVFHRLRVHVGAQAREPEEDVR
jgi:hypothetical protein